MKSLLLYLRRTVLFLAVLLLVGVVGGVLFTHTERFRLLLREELVGFLNTSFRGEVALERIEGSLWGNLTLRNLAVGYQGAEILHIPRVTLSYSLIPLLRGRAQVFRLEGFEPVMRLKQDAEGRWNLLQAFSSPVEEPEEVSAGEGRLAVLLDAVVLQGAQIDLTLAGEDEEERYHLAETALDAQVRVWPLGLEVQVRRLVAHLAVPGLPQVQVKASLAYQNITSPATVSVSELRLGTKHSRVRLTGEIDDLSTLDTDAELLIEKLAVSDLIYIFPDWPLKQDLSGTLRVTGPLASLHGNLVLAAVGAIEAVRGWAAFQGRQFALSQGRLTFAGEKEVNPALDIVAQYRLPEYPEYTVGVVVGGTAKKPALTLRSEPSLDHADILAVLLFGKPASALGQGEQVALHQKAIAITSGYAAAEIGQSVSRFLGLDSLGIDLRQIDFTDGRIGFGQYLTRKTYVSASQDLAGEKGQEVSVEYRLAPEWEITTSTSSSGSSGADIFWQKQY